MYLRDHARWAPHKPAMVFPNGSSVTFAELDTRSRQLAQLLRARGLRPGDHIALYMENNPCFMEVVWAAFRSGLYITPINRYLTANEAAYIARDCRARAIISSFARRDTAKEMPAALADCSVLLMSDGAIKGWEPYEAAVSQASDWAPEVEAMGNAMFYSSGTTGKPKGILRPLSGATAAQGFAERQKLNMFGLSDQTVYLSPAPLYHAAPLESVLLAQSFGATTIIMAKFEPLAALELIEKHGVTHSQWVPTMFVRMLKLPQAARERFDFSSHKLAVHAAAPCPVDVKRQMIEWWGPILFEYYAGSEAVGITSITSEEWLQHPGSVGRSILGRIHVCDDHGQELSVGEDGLVYFERDTPSFEYHDDPTKTQASRHPAHANWGTMGDIGHVDTEGFLYLTDRKAFTIISGGVNIYPQAIEDVLVMHPQVADVGVIGVPDGDLGEAVKAVVELQPGVEPTAELAAELQAFARARLASYMLPRSIDFTEQLPRLPTGKLYKQQLRDRYWPSRATEATTQCATAFLVSK